MFCGAFLLAAATSLIVIYSQPAVYRSVSRLQITPARGVTEANELNPPALQEQPQSFLTEVQVLTSRPLLRTALERLKGEDDPPDLGADPVGSVQRMLQAEPVEGTEIVQLSAEGPQASFVSNLVNAVAAAYRDRVVTAYEDSVSRSNADVNDEVQSLAQQVAAKRSQLEAYRERNNIVSSEREENTVLASIRELTRSYAASSEDLAKAQGQLEALRNANAEGGAAISNKDDPTLAAMEQRASTLREQLRDLQRRFTPQYLALDADTRALEERIAALDEQIKQQRVESQRAAIAAAQQELATHQTAVARLRNDLNANQARARAFAARLSEFKVMQDDLDHLQGMLRAAQDRLTKLQVSERERAPKIDVLEQAAPNPVPWRPNYTFNAGLALLGSLGFGLFAVWFTDFIGAPARARTTMIVHSPVPDTLTWQAPGPMPPMAPPPESTPRLIDLAPRPTPPRELEDSEIGALLSNASEDVRLISVALLSGIAPAEIAALRWERIDLASGTIAIEGGSARTLKLEEPFLMLLKKRRQRAAPEEGVLLPDKNGAPLSLEEIDRLVLCGAYDAGLERPQEITPAVLRHTYLAFLLRSGIRASDLDRIAGDIRQEELVSYMQFAASRSRHPLDRIEKVHPALRGFNG